MAGIEVEPYKSEHRPEWDAFIKASRNGTFLFDRAYMDYHRDRFTDSSLVFRDDRRIVAVLPANRVEASLRSHGGLTYGGFVLGERIRLSDVLDLFSLANEFARANGIETFIYKPVPHIYHRVPSEEDLYALFRAGARLVARAASATLEIGQPPSYTKGRKWSIGKAKRAGLVVADDTDYAGFIALETEVLRRHNALPTHTGAELQLLADALPDHIRLHTVRKDGELLAGVVVYATETVAHAQYIAASDLGRELGATDLILDHLIVQRYTNKRWFDFGISTEKGGTVLNGGLAEFKESFGARTTTYDCYELAVR